MRKVLILHGIGGFAAWQNWLAAELDSKKISYLMPLFKNAEHPDRKEVLNEIESLVSVINPADLVIVGHSMGVTSALDYIETLQEPLKALVSVSGFSEDYKAEMNSYFMSEKSIDWNLIHKNLEKSVVLYGDNDPYVPQETLAKLAKDLGVTPEIIHEGGHLSRTGGFFTFPRLLEIIESVV